MGLVKRRRKEHVSPNETQAFRDRSWEIVKSPPAEAPPHEDSGLTHSLLGTLIVLGWLLLCLILRMSM